MSTVPVLPRVLKDCAFIVEADNYEAHVSTVRFDPSGSSQTWQGMTPTASFTDTSSATWAAALNYAQDWETPNSLARYLHDHEGETVTVKFQPKKGTGLPEVTADLIIAPGPIGGDVNVYMTGSVTLGCSGKPAVGVAA